MTVSLVSTIILEIAGQHTENPYVHSEMHSYHVPHDSCPHASWGNHRLVLGEVKRFGHVRNVVHRLGSIVN